MQRACWSRITLLLGVLPLIFGWILWPLLVFSGLATIFIGLWTWRKPCSLVHGPRRWAAVVGILGGLTQVGGVGGVIYAIVWMARHG